MTITLENPGDCDDIERLREWILCLQEMVGILRQMEQSNKRMVDYSEKIMTQQDQKIALYIHQTELLKARIAQYETAFSFEHHNHVRRLN